MNTVPLTVSDLLVITSKDNREKAVAVLENIVEQEGELFDDWDDSGLGLEFRNEIQNMRNRLAKFGD
ncbi:MAG: hypothetical protein R3C03_00565 [Pirellulaceae bacterium]